MRTISMGSARMAASFKQGLTEVMVGPTVTGAIGELYKF